MNSAGIKKKKKGGTGGAFSIAPVAISPTVSWGDHQAQLPEARFGGFDGPEWVVGDSIQIDEPLPPPDIIDKWYVFNVLSVPQSHKQAELTPSEARNFVSVRPLDSPPASGHMFRCSPPISVRSAHDLPRTELRTLRTPNASPLTTSTIFPSPHPIYLPQGSNASRPPTPTPTGPLIPMAHLEPLILDPVTHTVVLVSSISATLSARLQFGHQSLLKPVFQTFADRVLKTKPVMIAEEVNSLLKKYSTGFSYDGIRRAREEKIQAFMHSWVQIGLDCATAAKEILSKDLHENISKQMRDKRATSTLREILSATVKLTFNQCLAKTNERIKELAQDHMITIDTHDHQALSLNASALHDQVFRGVPPPDNVHTVASEVHAYFNISSGEFIDGCIRVVLRHLMHQPSLQLSSEFLSALKLSEAGLSERCRVWVE